MSRSHSDLSSRLSDRGRKPDRASTRCDGIETLPGTDLYVFDVSLNVAIL
jgi:hypothetical protein